MPKGKNELQELKIAEEKFDSLLNDLAASQTEYFRFDTTDESSEISLLIANTTVTLKNDGTYTTE